MRKNKKVKMTFNVPIEVQRQIKNYVEDLGYKSEFDCMVYYDKNYLPSRRKNSRRDLFDYQPKSGTAVPYDYAVKKKL